MKHASHNENPMVIEAVTVAQRPAQHSKKTPTVGHAAPRVVTCALEGAKTSMVPVSAMGKL
ncbi:MAG: hypothetical protein DHS20C04_03260 [Hyphococcus sp.]|nr:MAG: hypothetical protein DHS20C04_03260 [Marinicaulis sp.]